MWIYIMCLKLSEELGQRVQSSKSRKYHTYCIVGLSVFTQSGGTIHFEDGTQSLVTPEFPSDMRPAFTEVFCKLF